MKTIFVFLVSFFLLKISYSQSLPEFAPIGATWYFNQVEFGVGNNYFILESLKEDTVAAIPCKNISNDYLYTDSTRLYYYNGYEWSILSDFNKQVGDSFYVKVYYEFSHLQDSFSVKILNKGDTLINGYSFPYIITNSFHFSIVNQEPYTYGGKIIQNIGCTSFLLPQPATIDPLSGPLRCYNDLNIGVYKNPDFFNGVLLCDTVMTGIETRGGRLEFNILPNPATEDITFTFNNSFIDGLLIITDIYGRTVTVRTTDNRQQSIQLSVKELPKGIYLYQFKSAGFPVQRGKFIVQ